MPSHHDLANLIWQIADLLRGPYRPPQYERVMLPMTVLRRFDCVLAPTKAKVLAEHERRKGGKLNDEALDKLLNKAAGQRLHNHSALDFEKLKGDPDHVEKHLVSYIKGFSGNVRTIFDYFEFENEIEKMREAGVLYLVVSKFCDVSLHPDQVPNEQMGLIFENLIRRFNELANETAGDHFTPREVIRLMVSILFINDEKLLATPGTVRKLLDPASGTGRMLSGEPLKTMARREPCLCSAGRTGSNLLAMCWRKRSAPVTVERPLRLCFQMTDEGQARFLADRPGLKEDIVAINAAFGRDAQRDWNAVRERILDLLHEHKAKWKAPDHKLFRDVFTRRDPEAEPASRPDSGFEPDADLRDFENVPLKEDIDAYFEREVRPHVPDAWMDRSKDKVGYEINFNRHFYKYMPPRPLEEIDADLKRAEGEIVRLLREVTA
jgi:hypothetical protein